MSDEIAQGFAQVAEEKGWLDEYCEEIDVETGQCKTVVAESIVSENREAKDPKEVDNEKVEIKESPDTPEETLQGGPENEMAGIESIVADCVGKTRFGISLPNEHACHRAFEKFNRRIQKLEESTELA